VGLRCRKDREGRKETCSYYCQSREGYYKFSMESSIVVCGPGTKLRDKGHQQTAANAERKKGAAHLRRGFGQRDQTRVVMLRLERGLPALEEGSVLGDLSHGSAREERIWMSEESARRAQGGMCFDSNVFYAFTTVLVSTLYTVIICSRSRSKHHCILRSPAGLPSFVPSRPN
jgi:hypothetical protein